MHCTANVWHTRVCICLVIFLLAGCATSTHARLTPTPTPTITPTITDPIAQWIHQNATPLQSTDPAAALDDLQPLGAMIGAAPIVGVGEGTHGSHEFFTMKQRILEYLVENKGFTMFAMEANWSSGQLIDDYIYRGQGDPRTVLHATLFWTWNTQEVLNMLIWMRQYNIDPTHTNKLRFAGFDCQAVEPITFDHITQYLQSVDPQEARTIKGIYAPFAYQPTDTNGGYNAKYYHLPHATLERNVQLAQQALSSITAHEAQYVARAGQAAFADAVQNATIIVQFTTMSTYSYVTASDQVAYSNYRDNAMAQNVAWLNQNAASGAKIMLWAHDGHIGTQTGSATHVSMGNHLRQMFGTAYVAVGFSFYQGSFNAIAIPGQTVIANTLSVPPANTANFVLGQGALARYVLDLRVLPAGPVQQWFTTPRPLLMVGATWDPTNPDDHEETVSLAGMFDVLIHLQTVTATQLI